MRRFASVFISSKREKNEKTFKRSTLNVRTQPAPSDITTFDSSLSTPQLSAGGSEPAHSSASSAGSVNLQTPEDIPISLVNSKKTWIPWRAKKSGTIKASGRHESNWTPLPPPLLHTPPPGTRAPIVTHNDPNSDSESDAYGEEDDPRPITPVLAKPIITLASQSKAQAVLQALIQNSLISRPSSAPFVVQPGAPPYPRSSNRSRSVPSTNSLVRTVLRKRMLQRLQDANLTSSEAKEIIAFSTRDTPRPEAPIDIDIDMVDEKALSTFDHTASFSIGLRSWINRPPFEDRFSVWSVVDGNITCQRVSNTPGFALAALEFSEAVEAEADVFGDIPPSQSSVESHLNVRSAASSDAPSSSSSASSHISSSASHSRSIPSPQLLAPSPLRNQASTLSTSSSDGPRKEPLIHVLSATSPASKNSTSVSPASLSEMTEITSPASNHNVIKRGVRFVEEEKDENIPIGYVMRHKKQREEKARFLREQKEKREFEEERARVEEERKKRDAERRKWEQERLAWEKEKMLKDEERKRKQYAEEVTAARQRAESSRMGMRSSSSASLREPERNLLASKRSSRGSEGPPSPRRQASESFSRDQSPVDSRPPSTASHAGYFPMNSRPSSIHSSEDVRSIRPQSTAFYIPPVPPIPQFYPYQSAFPLDMPLLPPAAPFMVNQYSRRQSHSSQSSSQQRVPSSSSTESLNRHSVNNREGSSPRESSNSSSSSPHRTHQRRTSDDSTRRVSTYSTSPHSLSSNHLPRGRLPNLAHTQQTLPSPWTAPPTLHGGPPSAYGGVNTVTRHTPARRQTTFS